MLKIDRNGYVCNGRIIPALRQAIERAPLSIVRGIIVHQTASPTREATLNSYRGAGANGAHFLIDRDGKIYQTASLFRQTWHVGLLRSRCLAEHRCPPVELAALKQFNPRAEHRREMRKSVPARYPANHDSIGIELVGGVATPKGESPAERGVFETVTSNQNDSLSWLVSALRLTFCVPLSEVFTHPTVSRKNRTEASSAKWD